MLSEIERITSITSELLLLVKPQALQVKPHGLLPLLTSVIKLLEPQAILKDITIHTSFPEKTPVILCEEYQIKQVFINIIKNGMESMPLGGTLTIQVAERTIDITSEPGMGTTVEIALPPASGT